MHRTRDVEPVLPYLSRRHLFEKGDHISDAVQATQLIRPPVLDFDLSRYAWHDSAACRGLDPELFFPKKGPAPTEAKAVCVACPVRAECLEQGLDTDAHGIWGGSVPADRRKLKKAGARARQEWLDKQAELRDRSDEERDDTHALPAPVTQPRPIRSRPDTATEKPRAVERGAVTPKPAKVKRVERPEPAAAAPAAAASIQPPRPERVDGRARRSRPASVRFWDKVEKTDDCWNWTGGRTFSVRSKPSQVVVYPYRFAYEHFYGPIGPTQWLRRECGNENCVRPTHHCLVQTSGATSQTA